MDIIQIDELAGTWMLDKQTFGEKEIKSDIDNWDEWTFASNSSAKYILCRNGQPRTDSVKRKWKISDNRNVKGSFELEISSMYGDANPICYEIISLDKKVLSLKSDGIVKLYRKP